MEPETDNSHNAVAQAIEKLRKQVSAMLSDGGRPNDLAFALAFVATEMSMQLMKTPTAAIPVVLHGMAAAAFAKSLQGGPESDCVECSEEIVLSPPEGVTLH